MDIKLLIEVVIKNDEDGKIINELIEKKLVTKDEIVDFVIESNNFDVIYYVAKYVDNVDVDKLEQKVLEIGSGEQLCKFAANIFGVNVSKFEDKIIEIGNPKYICQFAQYMEEKGANITRLEDKIIELGDAYYICRFVSCIADADIDRLTDAIIKTDEYYWIVYFGMLPGIPTSKLLDAVIDSGNYKDINFAIRMFGDKYTEKFVDLISEMPNPYTIYDFAEKYNSKLDKLSINKLADGIIKIAVDCDDMFVLELFIDNIDGAPVKKIKNVIENYNNGIYKNGYVENSKPKVKKKLFNRKS